MSRDIITDGSETLSDSNSAITRYKTLSTLVGMDIHIRENHQKTWHQFHWGYFMDHALSLCRNTELLFTLDEDSMHPSLHIEGRDTKYFLRLALLYLAITRSNNRHPMADIISHFDRLIAKLTGGTGWNIKKHIEQCIDLVSQLLESALQQLVSMDPTTADEDQKIFCKCLSLAMHALEFELEKIQSSRVVKFAMRASGSIRRRMTALHTVLEQIHNHPTLLAINRQSAESILTQVAAELDIPDVKKADLDYEPMAEKILQQGMFSDSEATPLPASPEPEPEPIEPKRVDVSPLISRLDAYIKQRTASEDSGNSELLFRLIGRRCPKHIKLRAATALRDVLRSYKNNTPLLNEHAIQLTRDKGNSSLELQALCQFCSTLKAIVTTNNPFSGLDHWPKSDAKQQVAFMLNQYMRNNQAAPGYQPTATARP